MRSLMPEGFLFRHFFDGLALGGALAEWGLACWLLDLEVPVGFHLVVPALLAVVNRLAARRFEREPVTGILTGRAGYVTLAIAFGALVSAGVLAVLASAWVAGSLLGALSAEAGMVARLGPEPIFGTAFRWIGGAAVGLAGGTVAYGYLRGYRELVVTPIVVPLRGLPAPVRLVHVSDLHLGPLADRAALREALDRVAALAPDLVCVTGDLVDSPATDLDAWMPELARSRRPTACSRSSATTTGARAPTGSRRRSPAGAAGGCCATRWRPSRWPAPACTWSASRSVPRAGPRMRSRTWSPACPAVSRSWCWHTARASFPSPPRSAFRWCSPATPTAASSPSPACRG